MERTCFQPSSSRGEKELIIIVIIIINITIDLNRLVTHITEADPGGGEKARTRRPPKMGINMMIFLRKIVIFSHEIPQTFSRLAPLGAIILSASSNLKSWIRPCFMNSLLCCEKDSI